MDTPTAPHYPYETLCVCEDSVMSKKGSRKKKGRKQLRQSLPSKHLTLRIPKDVQVIGGSLCLGEEKAKGQVFPEWAEEMREDSVGESPRKPDES